MKTLGTIFVALLALGFAAPDVEAGRLGGGRNLGMQRGSISQQQQAAPKAPAQQQQQGQQAAATASAQQPAGASKWLGPLAGLALGAGLAALFLHNGIAGLLAGLLLLGLFLAAVSYFARLARGKVLNAPIQYAGPQIADGRVLTPAVGAAAPHSVAATSRWPSNFDAGEFMRHAKLNFVRLQAIHDQRDLATMRDFLTPEMYEEIEADILAAGDAPQKTEVVTLTADVLEVSEEDDCYIVSVRFSGLIRERAGEEPQPFSELWHLEKPVTGRTGWLVAGIQQA